MQNVLNIELLSNLLHNLTTCLKSAFCDRHINELNFVRNKKPKLLNIDSTI